MRKRQARGFTLIELVIALALSTFVLVGVMMLATTMVRQHFDSLRAGTVSNVMLYALDGMNRDIEDATHLEPNMPSTGGGRVLAVCQDWSPTMAASGMSGGAIDGVAANVKTIIYCVDGVTTGATAGASVGVDPGNILWRYELDGSCTIGAVTCGSAPGAGTWQQIISHPCNALGQCGPGIWPGDAGAGANPNYFARMQDGNGVFLNYIVGHSTPSTNIPHPAYFKGLYSIHMQRHVFASAANPPVSDD